MEATVDALQQTGTPPQQLNLMRRLVSPPLTPGEVVRTLFPKIGAGAIQNMRIVGGRDLGAQGRGGAAWIVYQYTLLPQAADPVLRSLLPPVLLQYGQVPMQGEALIYTSPVTLMGVVKYWSFSYQIVEAPQQIFASNAAFYNAFFQGSYVPANAPQPNTSDRDAEIRDYLGRRKALMDGQIAQSKAWRDSMGTRWTDIPGGKRRFRDPHDPSWSGTVTVEDIPIGAQYQPYRCSQGRRYGDEVVFAESAPPGCTGPLVAY
jgi:hypothetical protein